MSDNEAFVTELLSAQIASLNTENAALRAEIDRLHCILAALREPSEGVVGALMNWLVWTDGPFVKNAIRAAVTAAELEVGA